MEGLLKKINQFLNGPEISIFHEFHKPPYGGGNQFLLALEKELVQRGLKVGRNQVGPETKVCLFNSFNFDFEKLSALKNKYHPVMIHRVDGPISVYRGTDQEIDKGIWKMNHDLADKTIFQSKYSLDKHLEMGLEFKNPTIITNATDPTIFNTKDRRQREGKIRLVASAWSPNPNKGSSIYEWLDNNLDFTKYEFTFIGNSPYEFKNIKHVKPVPSEEVARILKENDIYITASKNDPCSNALIEALSCGLPAVYLNSGGHPELVGNGGEKFEGTEDIIGGIEKVANNLKEYQDKINAPKLSSIVDKYVETFFK